MGLTNKSRQNVQVALHTMHRWSLTVLPQELPVLLEAVPRNLTKFLFMPKLQKSWRHHVRRLAQHLLPRLADVAQHLLLSPVSDKGTLPPFPSPARKSLGMTMQVLKLPEWLPI